MEQMVTVPEHIPDPVCPDGRIVAVPAALGSPLPVYLIRWFAASAVRPVNRFPLLRIGHFRERVWFPDAFNGLSA
jgi:hypothetical protein